MNQEKSGQSFFTISQMKKFYEVVYLYASINCSTSDSMPSELVKQKSIKGEIEHSIRLYRYSLKKRGIFTTYMLES